MSSRSWKDIVVKSDSDFNNWRNEWIYEFTGPRRFYEKRNPYSGIYDSGMIYKDQGDVGWANYDETEWDKGQDK